MKKIYLLQAICAVAMLAAGSAYAQQTETPAGTSGPSGAPNPVVHQPGNDGAGSSGATDSHRMHRMAMARHTSAMHNQTSTSQDAAVDQLNEQSYQAAQQGQAFNGSDTRSAIPATRSGNMGNPSGGAVPSNASGGTETKP